MIGEKWGDLKRKWSEQAYSVDKWRGGISGMRQFLRGWGNNLRGEYKRNKARLTKEIEEIDSKEKERGPEEELTQRRALLEAELEKIMEAEEIYWQQRGGERWVLEGDANTNFFHLVANGRRRKKLITVLEHEGAEISDKEGIQEIICDFYKKLFGQQPVRKVRMGPNAWDVGRGKLSVEDNEELTRPFTEDEIRGVIWCSFL